MKNTLKIAVFTALLSIACAAYSLEPKGDEYLKAAKSAAAWLHSQKIPQEKGAAWPYRKDGDEVGSALYSGSAGGVLFMTDIYHLTKDKTCLQDASDGADYLVSQIDPKMGSGLYSGLAGLGFALNEAYKVTGKAEHKAGFLKCIELIKESAVKTDNGVNWGQFMDIVSGTAGTTLFLLYAADETGDQSCIDLAAQAGMDLVHLGLPMENGTTWPIAPGSDYIMPNFSHGTAGVCFALARIYEKTENEMFLNAALSGATYLQSVANTEHDGCLVFHSERRGLDLYYLGWCHGPSGTSRLFNVLGRIQPERDWASWAEKGAASILASGIPDHLTPGFWNNMGACCGNSGVSNFMLDLYDRTGNQKYLDFARKNAQYVLEHANHVGSGAYWTFAENRVSPDELTTQTGYMQGAAGIGMFFLNMYRHENNLKAPFRFPDLP